MGAGELHQLSHGDRCGKKGVVKGERSAEEGGDLGVEMLEEPEDGELGECLAVCRLLVEEFF